MTVPKHVDELLEDLAETLQVPESAQEAAERSYKSVGEWLNREDSRIRVGNPKVYIQGSFRLGTTIRPPAGEDYDLDLVCELSYTKTDITQAELKRLMGIELAAYAKRYDMQPPTEGRRCWTQQYADSAQFHMDTLPAIPDATTQRLLLEQYHHPTTWADTAIAITDKDHKNYRHKSSNWPHSNPKGYSNWFRMRMQVVFEARKKALALQKRASVESIPEYKVRTPLQSAIQILKHHRDQMFADDPDVKPISIIITTLAAHAYNQEGIVSAAIYSILDGMEDHIEQRNGVDWIANPTDPAENFADRWVQHPERRKAFYDWLAQARLDFAGAAKAASRALANQVLEPRFGKTIMESATARRRGLGNSDSLKKMLGSAVSRIINPSHRQSPPWRIDDRGKVDIAASVKINGFRTEDINSDGDALPKHASLKFEATTNIPHPYQLYWQVVNTGQEAAQAKGLRGGFELGTVTSGPATKGETTLYRGTHTIECFIVKNGAMVASSGQFIVNIQ